MDIDAPAEVVINRTVTIHVVDEHGAGVEANVLIVTPNGSMLEFVTDKDGYLRINGTLLGEWKISAAKVDFEPASARMMVVESVFPRIIRTTSYLMPFVLVVVGTVYARRRRTKIVMDEATLRSLMNSDRLEKYGRVYTTPEIFNKFPASAAEGIMRAVRLSDDELMKAEDLASEHGIGLEEAKLFVLCEKIKAKRFIVGMELPDELSKEFRGTKIASFDEEQL